MFQKPTQKPAASHRSVPLGDYPVLLDAKLVTMPADKMLFMGIERGDGGAEFVQEWSVLVLAASKTG